MYLIPKSTEYLMQEYELCVLFSGNKTEQENSEIAKTVEQMLTEAEANVKFNQSLGRKRLAYKITNNAYGDYKIWLFEAEKDKIQQLNEKLRMLQTIARHLIIKLDNITIAQKIKEFEEPNKREYDDAEKESKAFDKRGTYRPQKIEKPAHISPISEEQKPSSSGKISLDQLDEKLDELLESDKI